MANKEITDLRKAGKIEEALELARQDLEKDPSNIWCKRAISWVYYEYLKKYSTISEYDNFIYFLEKLKLLELPEEDKMVFDNSAFIFIKLFSAFAKKTDINYSKKIDKLFELIKSFNFTKSSASYSILYKSFHKVNKNWDAYLDFADWWGFDNFCEEDFKGEVFNERPQKSIVEQAYTAYSKKLLAGKTIEVNGRIVKNKIDEEKIRAFMPKLDAIIKKYPTYEYLLYYKAKMILLLKDSNKDEILKKFLPFAKRRRNDFWVWSFIAELLSDNKDLEFVCYCKALSLGTQEDFLVGLHQKLAEILIEKKMYKEAKTEIENLIKIRKKNNWKIKNPIINWISQDWYKNTKQEYDNKILYSKHLQKAEEVLFQNIEEELIAVDFVNKTKKKLNFIKDKNKHGFFNYANFIDKPNIGDLLKVRFIGNSKESYYKIATVKKVDANTESSAIRKFEGDIRINDDKTFGFVDNIFINPVLVEKNKLKNKQKIKGTAILSYNKKKNEFNWRAFLILNTDI